MDQIPPSVQYQLMSYVSVRDKLITVPFVCTRWRDQVMDNRSWANVTHVQLKNCKSEDSGPKKEQSAFFDNVFERLKFKNRRLSLEANITNRTREILDRLIMNEKSQCTSRSLTLSFNETRGGGTNLLTNDQFMQRSAPEDHMANWLLAKTAIHLKVLRFGEFPQFQDNGKPSNAESFEYEFNLPKIILLNLTRLAPRMKYLRRLSIVNNCDKDINELEELERMIPYWTSFLRALEQTTVFNRFSQRVFLIDTLTVDIGWAVKYNHNVAFKFNLLECLKRIQSFGRVHLLLGKPLKRTAMQSVQFANQLINTFGSKSIRDLVLVGPLEDSMPVVNMNLQETEVQIDPHLSCFLSNLLRNLNPNLQRVSLAQESIFEHENNSLVLPSHIFQREGAPQGIELFDLKLTDRTTQSVDDLRQLSSILLGAMPKLKCLVFRLPYYRTNFITGSVKPLYELFNLLLEAPSMAISVNHRKPAVFELHIKNFFRKQFDAEVLDGLIRNLTEHYKRKEGRFEVSVTTAQFTRQLLCTSVVSDIHELHVTDSLSKNLLKVFIEEDPKFR